MMEGLIVRQYQSQVHKLALDQNGELNFTDELGETHLGVMPVRAFPINAPGEGVSLVGNDGHELAWIASLAVLDAPEKKLIEQFLARREFTPVIECVEAVSSFATPSTWTVRTDRGPTSFVLKGEEDIRRLQGRGLLITDSHGVTYHVADMLMLDRASRRLLDRFL
jgi:hypothetical protein